MENLCDSLAVLHQLKQLCICVPLLLKGSRYKLALHINAIAQ